MKTISEKWVVFYTDADGWSRKMFVQAERDRLIFAKEAIRVAREELALDCTIEGAASLEE
jgi:hypothetical protein